jgi:D-2-hydroxyacid dehydrogenase (NADP+)
VHMLSLLLTIMLTATALNVYAGDLSKPSAAAVELIKQLDLREGKTASRDFPGWQQPQQITVMIPPGFEGLRQPMLDAIKRHSSDIPIKIYNLNTRQLPLSLLQNTDVAFSPCNTQLLQLLPKVVWLQQFTSGVEKCTTTSNIERSDFILTNTAGIAAPTIAEHAITLMLSLSRQLPSYHQLQQQNKWQQPKILTSQELSGKTMLVLGLGSIGNQVAKRAHGLGMRVIATRNSSRNGPDYVDYVGLSDEIMDLAKQADVVVNALPYTKATDNIINGEFFAALKKSSYYISVGRGKTTDLAALTRALQTQQITAAGLDVTEPEPLPADHPLWNMHNVIITPHVASLSQTAIERSFVLYEENLRRYINGDRLLNVVDLKKGY